MSARDTTEATVGPEGLAAADELRRRGGVGVELTGLTRRYGEIVALDHLDLSIEGGEFVALLGPSGCGKTTALRVLAGFERPDEGTVSVGGRDVTGLRPSRRDMGMVFQAYSLFPNLTVAENIGFGPRVRGTRAPARRARAEELLELVGLPQTAKRYPHQLSGGQQQRIALARALAVAPQVLLLDEPLSALDAQVRVQLRDEIRRLQLDLGITTVFVTHDQAEALSVADRVAVMRAGRIEQIAAPAELYRRPATEFVAGFVGTTNRLPAELADDGSVELLGLRRPAEFGRDRPAAGPVRAYLRPEAVRFTGGAAGATVVNRTFLGAISRVTVLLSDGTEVVGELPSAAATGFGPGAVIGVGLDESPILVLASEPADSSAS